MICDTYSVLTMLEESYELVGPNLHGMLDETIFCFKFVSRFELFPGDFRESGTVYFDVVRLPWC